MPRLRRLNDDRDSAAAPLLERLAREPTPMIASW